MRQEIGHGHEYMVQLKSKYDPQNLFRTNKNIKTAA